MSEIKSSNMYDVVIVGAGSSGLAAAKALQFHSLNVLLIESGPGAGHSWRVRYQFTKMTSPKQYLALPGQALPDEWEYFPSFSQYADYLDDYAKNFNVLFNTRVVNATRERDSGRWAITLDSQSVLSAKHIIIASGWYSPNAPASLPGTEKLERPVYDANELPHPDTFTGKTVLIVGMGNTGADVGMALVQSGANVIFGIRRMPTISSVFMFGLMLHDVVKYVLDYMPPVLKDIACTAGMIHAFRGPFAKHFPPSLRGTRWMPIATTRLPTLDFGDRSIAKAIKTKKVEVIRGPKSYGPGGTVVGLDEGVVRHVDALVTAIGFDARLPDWLNQTDMNGCHLVGQRGVVANPIDTSIRDASRVAETIVGPARKSSLLAASLLLLFCAANFIEILSGSATFPALGSIAADLHIEASQSQWVVSAYNLCFAAFMLLSGRLSDVFSPKAVFLWGFTLAGVFSLGAGFCKTQIPLYISRAFQGVGASMAIPSAIRLICDLYPDQKQQGLALQLFATAGAVSNIIGFLIGGILTEAQSWRWTMWITSVTSLPVAILGLFLIPRSGSRRSLEPKPPLGKRLASVDIGGSLLVALFLILFVYALTQGDIVGWKTAQVIAPLVVCLSIVMPLFFIWEEFGRTRRGLDAALPNKVWGFPNFGLLFGVSVAAFYFYGCCFITFSTLWSTPAYAMSPFDQAKHLLPAGLATLLIAAVSEPLVGVISARFFLMGAMALYAGGGALLANVGDASHYWDRAVPGMVVGAFGAGGIYICCSKMLIQTGPASMSGVLGATFNSALQMGFVLSIGLSLALIGQIGTPGTFQGSQAAFYSLTAIGGLGVIACAFCTAKVPARNEDDQEQDALNATDSAEARSMVLPLDSPDSISEAKRHL